MYKINKANNQSRERRTHANNIRHGNSPYLTRAQLIMTMSLDRDPSLTDHNNHNHNSPMSQDPIILAQCDFSHVCVCHKQCSSVTAVILFCRERIMQISTFLAEVRFGRHFRTKLTRRKTREKRYRYSAIRCVLPFFLSHI